MHATLANTIPSFEYLASFNEAYAAYLESEPRQQLILDVLSVAGCSIPVDRLAKVVVKLTQEKSPQSGEKSDANLHVRGSARRKAADKRKRDGATKRGEKQDPEAEVWRLVHDLVPTRACVYQHKEYVCPLPVAEQIASRLALAGSFEPLATVVEGIFKERHWDTPHQAFTLAQSWFQFRRGLYGGDLTAMQAALGPLHAAMPAGGPMAPIAVAVGYPLRPEWLAAQTEQIQTLALNALVLARLERFEPIDDITALPSRASTTRITERATVVRGWLQGVNDNDPWQRGAAAFLRGEMAQTVESLNKVLTHERAWRKTPRYVPTDQLGTWHLIARLSADNINKSAKLALDADLSWARSNGASSNIALRGLQALFQARCGDLKVAREQAQAAIERLEDSRATRPAHLHTPYLPLFALALAHIDMLFVRRLGGQLQQVYDAAAACGDLFSAALSAELLSCVSKETVWGERRRDIVGHNTIAEYVSEGLREAYWRGALDDLSSLTHAATEGTAQQSERLVWLISDNGECSLSPCEQTRTSVGLGWSKGRPTSLVSLAKDADRFRALTPQDRRMCSCVKLDLKGNRTTSFDVDWESMFLEAIGHPLVFRQDGRTPVEIIERPVELAVQKRGRGFWLTISPQPSERHVVVEMPSRTRAEVTIFDQVHRRAAKIVDEGIAIPPAGSAAMRNSIAHLAKFITVRSDVMASTGKAKTVTRDARLWAQFSRLSVGYRLALRVKPLGADGPVYAPGIGLGAVVAVIEDTLIQTTRKLDEERKSLWEVIASSAFLSEQAADDSCWFIPEDGACLAVLLSLKARADQVVIEWDRDPLRLTQIDSPAIRVTIRSTGGWFDVTGSVAVDESRVLALGKVLDAMAQGRGGYVQLGDGEFLVLTAQLQRRLETLAAVGERHGAGMRIGRAAALVIHETLDGLPGTSRSRKLREMVDNLSHSEPQQLPSALRAQLRPYQEEGFDWLCRLAAAGVGACLADDMGLGKTLEALAVLLQRAADGPALVVAPTSVCFNWVNETARFAPTLNIHTLGSQGREDVVAGLGPRDVLFVSYGLLVTESKLFSSRCWTSVVLDEAQAIKNPETQRAVAAHQLDADFRLAMTGTPIENHLGELWSLMHFLNPGLLGTRARFEKRLRGPIEAGRDPFARRTLRALVRPFILRRTKADVLDDLPPRTDIVYAVELSDEERAFYEALRRKAVENLSTSSEQQRRFQFLADLTRLRQACCAVELVHGPVGDGDDARRPLESSKLNAFAELVDELREGGHKALVFSQFVSYLTLARRQLDAAGVSYQYLDGATPAKERAKRVEAFQSGDGELFLISLKAGGTGLNLTAADYVIHLDPWWNPAVEDQASDRAHRMGQTRAVTVYRLVAADTIEERIVALHREKRELAESLLEGTDAPAKLDLESLVGLL